MQKVGVGSIPLMALFNLAAVKDKTGNNQIGKVGVGGWRADCVYVVMDEFYKARAFCQSLRKRSLIV